MKHWFYLFWFWYLKSIPSTCSSKYINALPQKNIKNQEIFPYLKIMLKELFNFKLRRLEQTSRNTLNLSDIIIKHSQNNIIILIPLKNFLKYRRWIYLDKIISIKNCESVINRAWSNLKAFWNEVACNFQINGRRLTKPGGDDFARNLRLESTPKTPLGTWIANSSLPRIPKL